MTVPYALYAKTSGSGSGSGPVGPVGPTGNDGPQVPTGPQGPQGLAGGSLPSGGSAGQVLTMVNGVPTWYNAPAKIGDLRYGGMVFWVDPFDNRHGLVCSLWDLDYQSNWIDAVSLAKSFRGGGYTDWYLPSYSELDRMWKNLADSDGDNVNTGPIDPNNLGGFTSNNYWSSFGSTTTLAYARLFDNGLGNSEFKSSAYSVRAVRAF